MNIALPKGIRSKQHISMLLALGNGGLTILFYLAVVHFYGIGSRSDLFFASLLLPNVLFTVTFGQLTEILVPFFIDCEEGSLRSTAFWNVSFAVSCLATLFGGLVFWPMVKVFPLLFPGISRPSGLSATWMLLINSIYLIVFCVLTVKNCYLASGGHAVQMQLISVPGGILALVLLCLWGKSGRAEMISYALLCGSIASLIWPARANFWSYRAGHLQKHLSGTWHRVRWLVLNATVSRCEPLFDGVLSAAVGTGALSVFYLFQRLIGFVHTAVQNGYILPFTKQLSEAAQERSWRSLTLKLDKYTTQSIVITGYLLVLSAACLLPLRALPVTFARTLSGMFTQHWLIFVLLIPYGLSVIAVKLYGTGLYVLRLEHLFMKIGLGMFIIGMVLKIAAARLFALEGLAAATSAYWIGYALILRFAVKTKLKDEIHLELQKSALVQIVGVVRS